MLRTPGLFEHTAFYADLTAAGHRRWAEQLQQQTTSAISADRHGCLQQWVNAIESLPDCGPAELICEQGAVRLVTSDGSQLTPENMERLVHSLRQLHPWRKGPFNFFGVQVDTEWRSDLKWARVAPHVRLEGRNVLDVGCGNGYYGWRMLAAGARSVAGLDPFLLYVMQYEIVRHFIGSSWPHYVLPLSDQSVPTGLNHFDVAFSMGVLYHRVSPIEHVQSLFGSLVSGGTLVLETLILDSDKPEVLVPEGRYAKMRNVWFIPSVPMLLRWLRRCGFRELSVVDVSRTTTEEQRSTEWMTFESLADFLDPVDPGRTVEGYPAPVRAVVTAKKY